MKKFLSLLLLITLITGCRDTASSPEPGLALPGGDHVEVRFFISVKKDCSLKLFYADDEESDFTEAHTITKEIKAGNELQQAAFHLPEGMLNPQLRLDIKGTPEATIQRVTFVYGQRYIDAAGKEVFRYFRPDVSKCRINRQKGTVSLLNGSTTASLYPHEAFMDHRMKALTQ